MDKDVKQRLLEILDESERSLTAIALGQNPNAMGSVVISTGRMIEVLRILIEEVSEAKATARSNEATLGRML